MTILPCFLKTPLGVANPEFGVAVKIQIAGDLIALLVKEVMNSPTAYLEIWHWESGPEFSVRTHPPCAYSLLSEDRALS